MIALKKILVATDFSELSDAALAYGRELARSFGAQLVVLHVAENTVTRVVAATALSSPIPAFRRLSKPKANGVLTS